LKTDDIRSNVICIVNSPQFEDYFRAKIVEQLENKVCVVKYIDYGDMERVFESNLFYFPAGIEMFVPSADEIMLARGIPFDIKRRKEILEDSLLDKELVLVMEEEETGAKVSKFLRKQSWENKPKEVEEGDVIVESIKEINTTDEQSLESWEYETEKECFN